MSDADHSTTEPNQTPRRKLWPWVITSVVALLAALFLTVWIPQEQDTDLLARIDAAGGYYSIDTTGRPEAGSYLPEAGSILDDMEYVELFDRVEHLTLPKVDPQLFHDSVAAFKSLESMEIDLANSVDFDRDTASRMTKLEQLKVMAERMKVTTDYEFLAGFPNLEYLLLDGWYHDDGFWKYLPAMKSLKHLVVTASLDINGEGIPDLSSSNLESLLIDHDGGGRELRNFSLLLTAPRLKEIEIVGMEIVDIQEMPLSGSPALDEIDLIFANMTDDILPILAQCNSLRYLELDGNNITGKSLDRIASLPLKELELSANPLTDNACRHLSKFKSLEILDLRKSGLQTEWLKCWADSPLSSNLTELVLFGNEIGDEVIDVVMTFAKLQKLYIQETDISEEAILKLAEHPSLNYLMVDGNVSDETVEQFWKKVAERGSNLQIHRAH